MEKEIFDHVVSSISSIASARGSRPAFSDRRYVGLDFSKKNFCEVMPIVPDRKFCFVDAGNFELFGTANFSVQFIRCCAVFFSDGKKDCVKKSEFYCVTRSVVDGKDNYLEFETFPGNIEPARIPVNDPTLSSSVESVSASKVGELVRMLSEIKLAADCLDSLGSGDVIVMDGILQPKLVHQAKAMELLFSASERKEVILCSIAKTTDMVTDSGSSVAFSLSQLAPDSAWYYLPFVINNNPAHPVEILMAKFHEKSRYCFRFEISKRSIDEIPFVVSALADNSSDPVFLGYPYGLQLCHQLSRISAREAEQITTLFKARLGRDWLRVEEHLRQADAHSILDRL
jgi:hypothetical protein